MNIFYLYDCPIAAAQAQCDKHVVKMILESAQMLCSAQRLLGNTADHLYKITHQNHPCTVWVREAVGNYRWLLTHFEALCDEYSYRYGKTHLCRTKLQQTLTQVPASLSSGMTPFRPAVGSYDASLSLIENYRRFYAAKHVRMPMVWTRRQVPDWFNAII